MIAGLVIQYLDKLPFLGRLPGDIVIERQNFKFIPDRHQPFDQPALIPHSVSDQQNQTIVISDSPY